jgi:hypothetical protein
VLAFAWQFGLGNHPTRGSLLPAFLMIGAFASVAGILLGILSPSLPALRRRLGARRRRQQHLATQASAELRLRLQMDELCPDGWQAQITLFSAAEQLPPEAPNPERTRVALDWAQLAPDMTADTVMIRRVWAETVTLALGAMVADRVTEETLTEIEQLALSEGAEWPEE